MLDKLEAFLDINEIESKASLLEAWAYLVAHPHVALHNYAKDGWILVYFQQLLNGRLDEETFFALWDSSELATYEDREYMQACRELEDTDWIVLLDSVAKDYYELQTGMTFALHQAQLFVL